ncbi:phosphodiesterase [Amycolatopsis nigrescens]|uniref:phosphodiesterase n=1 Tax=Amycolatopsis nigrescens TaxID=381445 RepID=UPI00037A32F7|nr:phosphodiesterase [Amycolatopsis nigrescens]
MIVLAQVSDLHLDGGERSTRRAEQVLAHLNGLTRPVDALLVTGDIADHGLPAEYRQARKLLEVSYPVFGCPGNHDRRAAYREDFLGEPPSDAPINRVERAAGAAFVLCDSTIPGEDPGLLADETIAWLDQALAGTAGEPTFVVFHHPPVPLHQPYVDELRQQGEQRLAEVLARHRQVVGLLCGHAHTAAATRFAGLPLLVAPAVASTLMLPWEAGDMVDLERPPALAFHVLDDDRRLTTHYRVVPG